jgi:hypothetical protein
MLTVNRVQIRPSVAPQKRKRSSEDTDYQENIAWGPSSKATDSKFRSNPDIQFQIWKPPRPHELSLQDVHKAYKQAKNEGCIMSSELPRLQAASLMEPGSIPPWDPYVVEKEHLRHAMLDKRKLEELRKQLAEVVNIVPEGAQWAVATAKSSLAPQDLRTILSACFGRTTEASMSPQTSDIDTPYIPKMAAILFRRSEKQLTNKRVSTLTRIVGFALMRVFETTQEVTSAQVSSIQLRPYIYGLTENRLLL